MTPMNLLVFGLCCGRNDMFLPTKLIARGQYASLASQCHYIRKFQHQNLLSFKIAFLNIDVLAYELYEYRCKITSDFDINA